MMTDAFERAVRALSGLPAEIARIPALARGRVWCRSCGASREVAAAHCLRSGWPRCCGVTMTIDAPGKKP
ncbi:MAG: hypothetical protein E6G92_04070 [Alphaproteobacteria bacterium]|nr:MAG: hypothetical protein E6G92_04070 [Alphaproteobacteria bacterium]